MPKLLKVKFSNEKLFLVQSKKFWHSQNEIESPKHHIIGNSEVKVTSPKHILPTVFIVIFYVEVNILKGKSCIF